MMKAFKKRQFFLGMDDCSTLPSVSFIPNIIRPSLLSTKTDQNKEDPYSHRNSNGSCSSRGSSSGFESMKVGFTG